MRYLIGRLLEWLNAPAFVKPFRFYDGETGQVVSIQTSPRYTTLTVGRKEFFFIRETGKCDGYGAMSLEDDLPSKDCRADYTPESTDARARI
jgi:hypothetical protein